MVAWTREQLDEYRKRQAQPSKPAGVTPKKVMPVVPLEKPETLNKTEREFALWLSANYTHHILIQSVKLRLADKTWYTPDFVCLCTDGVVRVYETKGFMRDDAAVKIKVAAEQYYMAQFYLVTKIPKKKGGGWNIKLIPPHES